MPRQPTESHVGPSEPNRAPSGRRTLWKAYRRHRQWADITAGFGLGLGTGLVLAALIGALPL